MKNLLILHGEQTRIKRKYYDVIMWLKMALELLPDSSWRLLCVDSPIGFRQPDCLVAFDDITKSLIGSIIDVSVWFVGDAERP